MGEADLQSLLARAEDSRELLGGTVAQQQEMLDMIGRAINGIAVSRERAQLRESRLRKSADRLVEQARQAVAAGREDYARQALAWRVTIGRHADELTAEQAVLRASEQRLSAVAARLRIPQPRPAEPATQSLPDRAAR